MPFAFRHDGVPYWMNGTRACSFFRRAIAAARRFDQPVRTKNDIIISGTWPWHLALTLDDLERTMVCQSCGIVATR